MSIKKKPLQILLTEDQKAFIRGEAERQAITMNAYLLGLVKKDQKQLNEEIK
jgi:hypothetical protein